jgi:hypothetical protein
MSNEIILFKPVIIKMVTNSSKFRYQDLEIEGREYINYKQGNGFKNKVYE